MKKFFYISLGLFLLVLIFLGAYNFVFRNNVNNPIADPDKQKVSFSDENPTPAPPASEITSPINEQVLGATVSESRHLYYYSLDDKSLKKASLEGKNKEVLLSHLPGNPTRLVWSPKRDKVLLQLQSNGSATWHFADLSTKMLVPLKPEMSRLAWSNLGDKIFYQYTNEQTGSRSLNIANPDGSDWKEIAALPGDSFIQTVPRSSLVSFWSRPNSLAPSAFGTVSFTGDNPRTLLEGKYGADFLWSPTGERALLSQATGKGGNAMQLALMNANGGEFTSLAIPTFIQKAAWSQDGSTVYFALPGSLPQNAVMPNDYFDKPLYTADTFWKIDLRKNEKSRILDLKGVVQNFDSTDLFLSPDEDMLFFTDRIKKRLYKIEL